MPAKRVILEMGAGNDLHGGDYTKAAIRAVEDAIHHSSLTMIRTLKVDTKTMQVNVTIGVRQPERPTSSSHTTRDSKQLHPPNVSVPIDSFIFALLKIFRSRHHSTRHNK